MKILTFSTLYPNAQFPSHGIFVETRLRHLLANFKGVSTQVVAPVPWFPFSARRFGRYGKLARIPRSEVRHDIQVIHPGYLHLPKIGMASAPQFLARASLPVLKNLIATGFDFDIIDAHYYYPDGVAATMLGKQLGKPVIITARGTDINLIPHFSTPRKMILQSAHEAAASITVCEALKSEMTRLGAESSKIYPLRNGVDLQLFQPIDREKVRRELGWTTKTLVSVGHLIERKGHHLVIDAMRDLRDFRLVVIGSGEEKGNLHRLACTAGVRDRVDFLPSITQTELLKYYGASDALVLASSREGWANVLLEAMACGTPVVATNIWGTPEVVKSRDAGVLVPTRTADAIVTGVKALFADYPDHSATRRYAEGFNWRETSEGQMALFCSVLARKAA
ncbi:MAG: glycosyltransferase family 4 protein [Pseudomonadota bacterium]|nr:glycosyltransferase family 4 protein [Pseudomonadota bacterium]